jgi:hypothetical protein
MMLKDFAWLWKSRTHLLAALFLSLAMISRIDATSRWALSPIATRSFLATLQLLDEFVEGFRSATPDIVHALGKEVSEVGHVQAVLVRIYIHDYEVWLARLGYQDRTFASPNLPQDFPQVGLKILGGSHTFNHGSRHLQSFRFALESRTGSGIHNRLVSSRRPAPCYRKNLQGF